MERPCLLWAACVIRLIRVDGASRAQPFSPDARRASTTQAAGPLAGIRPSRYASVEATCYGVSLRRDVADVRGPVAQRGARAAAGGIGQVRAVGARLGDVFGGDPDAIADHRRRAIVAPARTAAAEGIGEHFIRGEAIPHSRAGRGDLDVAHADLGVEPSESGAGEGGIAG